MFHTGGAGTRSAPCAPEARVQRPLLRACAPRPPGAARAAKSVPYVTEILCVPVGFFSVCVPFVPSGTVRVSDRG